MYARFALAIICMIVLRVSRPTPKTLYLSLVILMLILGQIDRVPFEIAGARFCAETMEYRAKNEVANLTTYLSAYVAFDLGYVYLFLLIWRAIGVILFLHTRKVWLLVAFPDCMKEYLLYASFFGNLVYFPIVVGAKIAVEALTLKRLFL